MRIVRENGMDHFWFKQDGSALHRTTRVTMKFDTSTANVLQNLKPWIPKYIPRYSVMIGLSNYTVDNGHRKVVKYTEK